MKKNTNQDNMFKDIIWQMLKELLDARGMSFSDIRVEEFLECFKIAIEADKLEKKTSIKGDLLC